MKIEALRDFDIGKPLTAGQQAEINDNDARGLISMGFAKAVDDENSQASQLASQSMTDSTTGGLIPQDADHDQQ